jgi:hypothetical protein
LRAGRGTITAAVDGISASAAITVSRPPARVAGVGAKRIGGHVVATARVLAGSEPVAGISLILRVRRGSSTIAVVSGRTGKNGQLRWRSRHKLPRGAYVARATIRSRSTASRTQQSSR